MCIQHTYCMYVRIKPGSCPKSRVQQGRDPIRLHRVEIVWNSYLRGILPNQPNGFGTTSDMSWYQMGWVDPKFIQPRRLKVCKLLPWRRGRQYQLRTRDSDGLYVGLWFTLHHCSLSACGLIWQECLFWQFDHIVVKGKLRNSSLGYFSFSGCHLGNFSFLHVSTQFHSEFNRFIYLDSSMFFLWVKRSAFNRGSW